MAAICVTSLCVERRETEGMTSRMPVSGQGCSQEHNRNLRRSDPTYCIDWQRSFCHIASYLCGCLSVCLSACVSVPLWLSVTVCGCLCLSVCVSICLPACLHVCIYLSACLPVCLYPSSRQANGGPDPLRLEMAPPRQGDPQGRFRRGLTETNICVFICTLRKRTTASAEPRNSESAVRPPTRTSPSHRVPNE